MYEKSTFPGENGFLFTHHLLLLLMTLNTLINKLIKLATGKYLKNDFLSIKRTESHGMIIIAKENTFFFFILNTPFYIFISFPEQTIIPCLINLPL